VNNIDATVIAEKPKLQEFIPAIIGNIAQILEIPASGISVKATTHEGLGSLGRGEGIATMAVVSIQKSKS
jgi:2-C-methyl-D-erythritol 2,4-cyclodiphosphate synthase